jgi:hypothetical protein
MSRPSSKLQVIKSRLASIFRLAITNRNILPSFSCVCIVITVDIQNIFGMWLNGGPARAATPHPHNEWVRII